MMRFHSLDLERYARRGQFDYFRSLAFPYAGLTVNLDITSLSARIRAEHLPFYLTVLYAASRTANAIPEFRRRIRGDGILEFDHCIPSYTLALENGNYCYCSADDRLSYPEFVRDAKRRQEEARAARIVGDGESADELFFFTTVPWTSYTALVQPVPIPADSNPRITWGKAFASGSRRMLPVSILVNHALMDGAQMSEFFSALQSAFDRTDWLPPEGAEAEASSRPMP
jgi:chloramphenicol O-acetyltransferase type A